MSTNANVFNSRVTSETLEKKFRDTFPAQAGAELIQDLYASGVIVPTIDFSAAASGDVLPTDMQQAWDFSTGFTQETSAGSSGTLISNAGFWLVDLVCTFEADNAGLVNALTLNITDGLSTKPIWRVSKPSLSLAGDTALNMLEDKFVVFLRSGDSLTYVTGAAVNVNMNCWYRQVATPNGDLVNPLGFTSS